MQQIHHRLVVGSQKEMATCQVGLQAPHSPHGSKQLLAHWRVSLLRRIKFVRNAQDWADGAIITLLSQPSPTTHTAGICGQVKGPLPINVLKADLLSKQLLEACPSSVLLCRPGNATLA